MIANLFKNGSSYSVNDQRSYDAWGHIRAGNTTGDPKARYVANLGHLADDESGLTYMRARYYEPSSGRFVSEDPAGDGLNWYVYCENNPVDKIDPTGLATLMDLIGSAGEEIKQKAMELQLMKGFENLLVQRVIGILSAYAAKFGEALGDDFALVFSDARAGRLWITGIERGNTLQIAVDFVNKKVILYGPNGTPHSLPPNLYNSHYTWFRELGF